MSTLRNVEVEYDSDPEEVEKLLGLRRRHAASDDEEENRGGVELGDKHPFERAADIYSNNDDCDGQGGAADYDDEDEEEHLEEEEDAYQEAYDRGNIESENNKFDINAADDSNLHGRDVKRDIYVEYGQDEEDEDVGEEEKKVNHPFAVPTAGAFYMHDDRFRGSSGGRIRRTGGRNLWESREDQRWGHDKFEDISYQDTNFGQGRRSGRGAYRGRGGKNRNMEQELNRKARPSKPFDNGDNNNETRKGVKGRGPRKYDLMVRNIQQAQPMYRHPAKMSEKSNISSAKAFPTTSNADIGAAPTTKKHSSLSYSSPPFYPSGSSNKDLPAAQKRGFQGGNKSCFTSGKNMAATVGLDKLYIDGDVSSEKPVSNVQISSSASSFPNIRQSSRNQSKGIPSSVSMPNQSYSPSSQGSRIPNSAHAQSTTLVGQTRRHPSVQVSNQNPPTTELSVTPCEGDDSDAKVELVQSKNALVTKGKGSLQTTGRGSFVYGGAPGSIGAGHGDQSFPTFLPVMQFGGPHPGGLGVPAVGMAFPGYVGQPKPGGHGNSEMTWLPVLTGAAGALGATYCSPYLQVDSTYHARPSPQNPLNSSSYSNENTPSTRNELQNIDHGQRQKARRYSEMDFKQSSKST